MFKINYFFKIDDGKKTKAKFSVELDDLWLADVRLVSHNGRYFIACGQSRKYEKDGEEKWANAWGFKRGSQLETDITEAAVAKLGPQSVEDDGGDKIPF